MYVKKSWKITECLFPSTYLKSAGVLSPRGHIYQPNKTSMTTFGDIQYDFMTSPKGPSVGHMKYSGLLYLPSDVLYAHVNFYVAIELAIIVADVDVRENNCR